MATEIPSGLNITGDQLDKAIAAGKFVHVNSHIRGPTLLTAGGITGMFASIKNAKKTVGENKVKVTPDDHYTYIPTFGIAGPFDDIVTVLRNLGYEDDDIEAAMNAEDNVTIDNFRDEGTISYEAAQARKAAAAERRAANPTVARDRSSGTTHWAALMEMANNRSKIQFMDKTDHMKKCSATRVTRAKKSQFSGLIDRISKRKADFYLDLNHIEKPANANRAIKWKHISEDAKVQGAYVDYDDFPIFSNNEANVRRFANAYKKVPVPDGMAKLDNDQVDAVVAEWKDNFDAWTLAQKTKKKKAVITSSTIKKSKIVGGASKAKIVKPRVKKTSTMSQPKKAAAKVVPVEDLEEDSASEAVYATSPRADRKSPRVLKKAGAKKPMKRGSRTSKSSAKSVSEDPEEFVLEEEDFDL